MSDDIEATHLLGLVVNPCVLRHPKILYTPALFADNRSPSLILALAFFTDSEEIDPMSNDIETTHLLSLVVNLRVLWHLEILNTPALLAHKMIMRVLGGFISIVRATEW